LVLERHRILTGLVNANFIYSGLDAAIHLAEESAKAAVAVPSALISTTIIGFATALTFAVAMMYSFMDFDAVLVARCVSSSLFLFPLPHDSSANTHSQHSFSLFEIWHQATRSLVAATVFLLVLASKALIAIPAVQQTASRLTHAFARDDALLGSALLSRVHPTWDVPEWALAANGSVVFLLGFVYLASTTAFNAIVSVALILQQLSFAIPPSLVLYRRVTMGLDAALPPVRGRFRMPGWIGMIASVLTLLMGVIAVVFYQPPVELPVTAKNMSELPPPGMMDVVADAVTRLRVGRHWDDGAAVGRELDYICVPAVQWPKTGKGRIFMISFALLLLLFPSCNIDALTLVLASSEAPVQGTFSGQQLGDTLPRPPRPSKLIGPSESRLPFGPLNQSLWLSDTPTRALECFKSRHTTSHYSLCPPASFDNALFLCTGWCITEHPKTTKKKMLTTVMLAGNCNAQPYLLTPE
jgi:amino acid transporter